MENGIYLKYQKLTKDKDLSVLNFIENVYNKTLSMFKYKNLPETIPPFELESILQRNGFCIVTDVDGKLYALNGSLGGELNAYYKPTKCIVANPYLNLFKEYTIENNADCVFFKNDYLVRGLQNIIGKFAVLLTDNGISLNNASILTRLVALISASDDNTKQSAEIYIEKLLNGDFSIVAENAFLKGVNVQTINHNATNPIKDLIELNQYLKAQLLAEIGLNANFNMKRERLNETEIALNVDEILPFAENMYTCRVDAVKAINEKYGTNIEVDFNSAWKTEHENAEKLTENVETISENDIINETAKIDDTANENAETVTNTNETKKTQENEENTVNNDNTDTDETEKIVNIIREMRENEVEPENDKENENN